MFKRFCFCLVCLQLSMVGLYAEELSVDASCDEQSARYRRLSQANFSANDNDTISIKGSHDPKKGRYPDTVIVDKRLIIDSVGGSAVIGQYHDSSSKAIEDHPDISLEDLAYHWAPIHYQDVNKSEWGGRADYVASIDRDGVWDISKNFRTSELSWDGTFGSYDLEAWCYYSVVETVTHYYILYAFYHPIDWDSSPNPLYVDRNNDLEGALFIITKDDPSPYGRREAILTQWHGYAHAYFPAEPELELGCFNWDYHKFEWGQILPGQKVCYVDCFDETKRVKTSQEAEGHGFGLYPAYANPNDDVIVYYPSRYSQPGIPPDTVPDGCHVRVPYKLVDIHKKGGLWENRYNPNVFEGDNTHQDYDPNWFDPEGEYLKMQGGHGNPPWQWNSDGCEGDAICKQGIWTHDPALFAQFIFKRKSDTLSDWIANSNAPDAYFNRDYLHNPYREDMRILPEDARNIFCSDPMSLHLWIEEKGGTCSPSFRQYPCDDHWTCIDTPCDP